MSRGIAVLLLAMLSCDSGQLDVTGDCQDAVLLPDAGRPCDAYPCRLARGTVLRLVDDSGCSLRSSDCPPQGSCLVQDETSIATQRTGWPVSIEVAGVANARLLPSGEDCTSGCSTVLPVETQWTVEALAQPGRRIGFSGDCDSVQGTRCLFVANRERRVVVRDQPDLVTVSVAVGGNGRVTTTEYGIDCPGRCAAEVPRGATVHFASHPAPTFVLDSWGDARCASDSTCALEVTDNTMLSVAFVPAVNLTLSAVDASGATRVSVDGLAVALPVSIPLHPGQRVVLRALPAADDVLVAFDGLACETPRVFDECAVTLAADTNGTLRMHKLHQWAAGAWPSLYLGNLDATDGGVFSAVFHVVGIPSLGLPQQSRGGGAVLELHDDGGIRVAGFGQTGLGPIVLMRDLSGIAWLIGNTRAGIVEPEVKWGALDAGIPRRGPGFQELAFLRLDGGMVDHVETLQLSMLDGTPSVAATTGPAVHSEGRLLTPLDWTGTFDGGAQSSGVASWASGFSLGSFRTSQRGRPVDLARVGGALLQLSLSSTPSTVVADTCQLATSSNQLVVSVLDGTAACTSPLVLGASSTSEGVVGYGPLMRGAEVAVWGTEQQELLGQNRSIVVRSMNPDLSLNWAVDVRPTPAPASFESLATFAWRSRFLSLISMSHDGETFVGAGGTTIRCAAAGGASSLILLAHATSTGLVEWGVCLDARESGAERFRLGQRNSLNYRSAELALGGVLIAPDAVAPSTGVMHVGASAVSVSNVAGHYYFLVTPP